MKLSLLLETAPQNTNNGPAAWVMLGILGIIIVLMFIRIFAERKRQSQAETMLNELKVGDKVVTNSGIYGEIVSMRETTYGKVALIKSGEGKNVSYINVNLAVILGVDTKEDVVLDENGKVIEPKEENSQQDIKSEVKELEAKKEVAEEKPKAKKTTLKKQTGKKETK